MLLIPHIRRVVVLVRLFYSVRILRRLRTANSPNAFDSTVSHNLRSLGQTHGRIDLLIKPLSVIETMHPQSRILVIGPRNEHDLLTLRAHGFLCVRGLDLISYSPHIDLGDMHHTPYHDGQWDVVMVGWTLSYSDSPQAAAAEMLRIAAPQAIFAIAVEYSTMTDEDEIALSGYAIQEKARLATRINSVDAILALFAPHVETVFFRHDAPRKRSHSRSGLIDDVSNVAVIFSVRRD